MGLFKRASTNPSAAAAPAADGEMHKPVHAPAQKRGGLFGGLFGGKGGKQAAAAAAAAAKDAPRPVVVAISAVAVTPPTRAPRPPSDLAHLAAALRRLDVDAAPLEAAAARDDALFDALAPAADALARAADAARSACALRANAELVGRLVSAAARLVAAHAGELDARAHGAALARLGALAGDAAALLDSLAGPGWLARVACDDSLRGKFVFVHTAVAECLRGAGLGVAEGVELPAGGAADYADGKRLKRLLKQLGTGSVEAGLRRASTDEDAAREVADLLGCGHEAVMRDAAVQGATGDAGAAAAGAALAEICAECGPAAEGQLVDVFNAFASFGTGTGAGAAAGAEAGMDSFRFAKLCKDCGLLGGRLTAQYVDIVFSRAKPVGSRRLRFPDFVAALALVAETRRAPLPRVVADVLASVGPAVRGTRAEYVKFHDDKSTFTGVHARGGPSFESTVVDLSAMVSRARENSATGGRRDGAVSPARSPSKAEFKPTVGKAPTLSTSARAASRAAYDAPPSPERRAPRAASPSPRGGAPSPRRGGVPPSPGRRAAGPAMPVPSPTKSMRRAGSQASIVTTPRPDGSVAGESSCCATPAASVYGDALAAAAACCDAGSHALSPAAFDDLPTSAEASEQELADVPQA